MNDANAGHGNESNTMEAGDETFTAFQTPSVSNAKSGSIMNKSKDDGAQ